MQVDPSAGAYTDLHMTLHFSDMLAHRPVVSTGDWTVEHFDMVGLSPWSVHQYSLQLEDHLGHKGKNYSCESCWTLEEGEGGEGAGTEA